MISDQPTPFDLRFRFLGFPCNIGVFFWVGAALLGDGYFRVFGGLGLLVWIAAILISILVHELGHAIAARAFGCRIMEVKLTMLGGYCSYDRQPSSRVRRIIISLAGPGAGFLLWGLLRGTDASLDWMDKIENLYVALFVGALLMINLAWSLFNLLPILPLDGGRVCEELCEGALLPNPAVTARWISVILAGSLVLLGLMNVSGSIPPRIREVLPWFLCFSLWTTLFMGLLAVQNYVELQQFRRAKSWGGFDDADDDAPWRGR